MIWVSLGIGLILGMFFEVARAYRAGHGGSGPGSDKSAL